MQTHEIDFFVGWEKIHINNWDQEKFQLDENNILHEIETVLSKIEKVDRLEDDTINSIITLYNSIEKLFYNIEIANPWISHFINWFLSIKSVMTIWFISEWFIEITEKEHLTYIVEIRNHLKKIVNLISILKKETAIQYLRDRMDIEHKLVEEWKISKYTPTREVIENLLDWSYISKSDLEKSSYWVFETTPSDINKILNTDS